MRLQLAHVRVVPPPAKPLPLPVLIEVLTEQCAAFRSGVRAIDYPAGLIEEAIAHLQLLNRLENSSVL